MIDTVFNIQKIRKLDAPSAVAWVVVAFLVYVAMHHMLTALIGNAAQQYTLIKIAKDLLIFTVLSAVFVGLLVRRDALKKFFSDKLNKLIIVYFILHLILIFPVIHTDQVAMLAGLVFNLRFLALFLLIRGLIALSLIRVDSIMRVLPKIVVILGFVVGLFGILQVTILPYDFMQYLGYDGVKTISPVSTLDDNPDMRRAFSTMRGPNEMGSYLILPICVGILMFLRKKKWSILAATGVMVTALWLTYSRSALLGCALALATLFILEYGPRVSRRLKITVAVLVGIIVVAAMLGSLLIPSIRLMVFHSSPTDPSLIEGSTADHFVAMGDGISDVATHPLGMGPGWAGPASFYASSHPPEIAESYFIQIAQEVGVFGLLLFIAICWLLVKQLMGKRRTVMGAALVASLVGLSVNALLLHTWADDPVSYTWWGLAAIVATLPITRKFGIIKGQRGDK